MNGLHEKYYILQNSIEAFVTHLGTERDRAENALRELGPLTGKDFKEHLESNYFLQIEAFAKQLRSGQITDEGLRRLLGNLWALFKSVSVTRDRLLKGEEQ